MTAELDAVSFSWEPAASLAVPALDAVNLSWFTPPTSVQHDAYGFSSSRMHAPARLSVVASANTRYAAPWRSGRFGPDGAHETVEPTDPDAVVHYATPLFTSSKLGEPTLDGQTAAGASVRQARSSISSLIPTPEAATSLDAAGFLSGGIGAPVSAAMNDATGLYAAMVGDPVGASAATAIPIAFLPKVGRSILSRGDHC